MAHGVDRLEVSADSGIVGFFVFQLIDVFAVATTLRAVLALFVVFVFLAIVVSS